MVLARASNGPILSARSAACLVYGCVEELSQGMCPILSLQGISCLFHQTATSAQIECAVLAACPTVAFLLVGPYLPPSAYTLQRFCSDECSRQAWKQGGHREECAVLKQQRAERQRGGAAATGAATGAEGAAATAAGATGAGAEAATIAVVMPGPA